jgi:hypothetical protein
MQGLKPISFDSLYVARLKPCPDTKQIYTRLITIEAGFTTTVGCLRSENPDLELAYNGGLSQKSSMQGQETACKGQKNSPRRIMSFRRR